MAASPRCVHAEAAEAKLGTAALQSLDQLRWSVMEARHTNNAFPAIGGAQDCQTGNGHFNAAIVQAANTAATGRLKNGRTFPSDLTSDVMSSVRPCWP